MDEATASCGVVTEKEHKLKDAVNDQWQLDYDENDQENDYVGFYWGRRTSFLIIKVNYKKESRVKKRTDQPEKMESYSNAHAFFPRETFAALPLVIIGIIIVAAFLAIIDHDF